MNDASKSSFYKMLGKVLSGYTGYIPKDEVIDTWWDVLAGYEYVQVANAVLSLQQERTKIFSPADVLQRLKTFYGENQIEVEYKAQLALNDFLKQYSCIYDYVFEDWRAAFAIRTVGGSSKWNTDNEYTVSQLTKSYKEFYKNATSICREDERGHVVKGSQRYEERCVLFIGDWDKCDEIAHNEMEGKWKCMTTNPNVPRVGYKSAKGPYAPMPAELGAMLGNLQSVCVGKDVSGIFSELIAKSCV